MDALRRLITGHRATWYKLVVWREPRSWALGIATGAALAAARVLINRNSPVPTTAR